MAVIGLKYLAVAPLKTEVDGQLPTYDPGRKIGHLISANLTWNRGSAALYGDNVEVDHDNTISSGDITVGTTYIDIAGRKMVLGEEEFGTPTGGAPQEYATVDKPAPYLGTGFVVKDSGDGDPKYIGYWYFKTQYSMNENNQTRGESTDYQAPEMDCHILAVRPAADLENRFRIFAEFDDEADAIAWVKGKAGIQ